MYTIVSKKKNTNYTLTFYRCNKPGIYRVLRIPYCGNNIEGEIDGVLYTESIIIKGETDLILNVGDRYYINYGIHQGEYTYIGKTIEHIFDDEIIGQHLFSKVGDEENIFAYYGSHSPYEMARRITKK